MQKYVALCLLASLLSVVAYADALPPTPAYKIFKTGSDNVTASTYNDVLELVGVGVVIGYDYSLDKITFTVSNQSGAIVNDPDFLCSGTDKVNGISQNNVTGVWTISCDTDEIGSGTGEANTMSSPTHANSLILAKVGVDNPIKGIACTGSAVCTGNVTDVTIDVTGISSNIISQGNSNVEVIDAGTGQVNIDVDGSNEYNFTSTSLDMKNNILDNVNYIEQNGASPATIGAVRLLNNEPLAWRNAANTNNDYFFFSPTDALTITISGVGEYQFDDEYLNMLTNYIKGSMGCSNTNVIKYNSTSGNWECETDVGAVPRGGYLMGMWTQSTTKTNIGTSFVNVYPQTNSNGKAVLIDTDTFTTVRLQIQWNKVGAGTQSCQLINGGTALVSLDVVSGSNDSGFDAIPAGLLNAENSFSLQCKSTTGTDDPIFESAAVWLK